MPNPRPMSEKEKEEYRQGSLIAQQQATGESLALYQQLMQTAEEKLFLLMTAPHHTPPHELQARLFEVRGLLEGLERGEALKEKATGIARRLSARMIAGG